MIAHPPGPRPARRVATTLGVALVVCSACSPKYYAPNTHNVPLLEAKGALTASVAAGDGRTELQGAYAVTDDVSVMVDAAFFRPEDDDDGDGGEGGIAEIGVGYQRGLSDRIRFEVYGLLGGGDLENHFPSTVANNPGTTGVLEGTVLRYGIQPALGFRSRYVHVAASTRVIGLRYSDVAGSLVFGGEDQVRYLRATDAHTLIEPAVTLRAGLQEVKLQLQVGRSFNLSHSDFRQDEGHVSIGLVYTPVRRGLLGR